MRGNRFAQPTIVMNEFRTEIAGDLAKMRDLTVTAANIKKAFRAGGLGIDNISFGLLRCLALLAAAIGLLLFLACHALTYRLSVAL